jgi:hypothetical protein
MLRRTSWVIGISALASIAGWVLLGMPSVQYDSGATSIERGSARSSTEESPIHASNDENIAIDSRLETIATEADFPVDATQAASVRSAFALQRLIDKWPNDVEVYYAAVMTLDLCDDPRFRKIPSSTIEAMTRRLSENGETARANYIQGATRQFCNYSLRLPYSDNDVVSAAAMQTRLSQMLPELEELTVLAHDVTSEDSAGDAGSKERLALLTGEFLSKTTSSFAFLEAGTLSIDGGAFTEMLRRAGYEQPKAVQASVAQSSLLLAACSIFGGCGAGELFTLARCIHFCTGPTTLEMMIVQITPPMHLDEVQRVARTLVAMRDPG